MAGSFERVRPGEVITSDLLNRIIDKLAELDARGVPSNGGITGPPVIDLTFDPPTEQAVGGELTITGTFDAPPELNTTVVDGVQITAADYRAGSNLTTLKFLVPTSIVVAPDTKKDIRIRVVNSQGVGDKAYRLSPRVQSAVPTPVISSVANEQNPAFGPTLQTNKSAAIVGLNFAETLANNTVRFRIGANAITVPTSSLVSVSAGGDRLIVIVPDMPDIGNFGSQRNVTLEVSVVGNNVAGTRDVMVMRVP